MPLTDQQIRKSGNRLFILLSQTKEAREGTLIEVLFDGEVFQVTFEQQVDFAMLPKWHEGLYVNYSVGEKIVPA